MNIELERNKAENRMHSIMLVAGMAAIMSLIGWMLFGKWGFFIACGLALAGLFVGPRFSAGVVLKMYKAKRIQPHVAPDLIKLFNELCKQGEQDPPPGLYYIPTRLPNAFAVGAGDKAAVAITDGLIRGLNPRELAGVLAHEIAHLRHHDTRVMGLADVFGRLTSLFSRIGTFMLLFFGANILMGGSGWTLAATGLVMFAAPSMIGLMQLALSRSREFNADMGAVEITGDPQGLASALRKIEAMASGGQLGKVFKTDRLKQPAFLRTHPETDERIRQLLEVAQENTKKREAIAAVAKPKQAIKNRSGEPIVYVGYPKVRKKDRYHVTTGVWH